VSESLQTLVQAARHNNEPAWDSLFRRYQLPLFTYARGLTGNREAAFDIVQETFARALAHIGGLRDDSKFGSWLFGIAHQGCVRHFRATRRDEAIFDGNTGDLVEEIESGDPDPRSMLLSSEGAGLLYELVDQLPVPQRSALLLHVLGDATIEDIARVTGVPAGTVKSRLFTAKRALRQLIGEDRP
jgi:RNA polymerase sigma-70 factor (ECF subfamily)